MPPASSGAFVQESAPKFHRLSGDVVPGLFLKDAGCAAGVADGGRLDLARSSLGGGGCQWRAQI